MKKLRKYILVSLLTALGGSASACGPFIYSAIDNRIYRIVPPNYQMPDQAQETFADRNVALWSRQTGCFEQEAIREALYGGWDNYIDWERMLVGIAENKHFFANPMAQNNAFCRRLMATADTDAVRLICWSKLYANIRDQQRSPWYYNNYVESDEMQQLRRLYAQLRQYKPTQKYADRYAFLTLKCAWALGEDSAALAYWQQVKRQMKKSIFYTEAEDYVARSLMRTGRKAEAEALYLRIGKMPAGASRAERLHNTLRINANAPQMVQELQDYLDEMGREQAASYSEGTVKAQAGEMLAVAKEAINNGKVRNKAMWRYTAACILDFEGKPKEALAMLKGAEEGGGNAFLKGSVRVLTFYLRSRTETVDDALEQYAIEEMKWMDRQLVREWRMLPNDKKSEIARAWTWTWIFDLNDLYYYSALRRIVLEDSCGLAWRMAEAGRGVRALQMANVADNRIVKLSKNKVIDSCRNDDQWYEAWYGTEKTYTNYHDYSNGLFVLADRMSAKELEAYRQRQLRPQDWDDRWMNARGYTDGNYWQDIVGTHYLRERNYAAAAAHLRHVSAGYQRRMNIRFHLDPFGLDGSAVSHDSTHYKLHFAQRMDSLQRVMLQGSQGDHRGLAMLEYSIGLENSFGRCWWLTSYQKGWNGANLTDIEETAYATKAKGAWGTLRDRALRSLRSDEGRAAYYGRLGMIETVMKRYPKTQMGRHYALVCDEWRVY